MLGIKYCNFYIFLFNSGWGTQDCKFGWEEPQGHSQAETQAREETSSELNKGIFKEKNAKNQ